MSTSSEALSAPRAHGNALLETIGDHIPGAIFQYRLYPDGHSCFPYASRGMFDMLALHPGEIRESAASAWARLAEDQRALFRASIDDSAARLAPWRLEFAVERPQQGRCWLAGSAHPERLDDGSTLWSGVIIDISERKAYEQKLIARSKRFRNILNNLPASVALLDRDGRVMEVNLPALKAQGIHYAAVAGQSFIDAPWWNGDPDARRWLREALERARRGSTSRTELVLRKGDGSTVALDLRVAPMEEPDAGIQEILVTATSVEQRKQAEQQLSLFQSVFEHGEEAVLVTDAQNRMMFINSAFTGLTGYSLDDVKGRNPRLLASGLTPRETYGEMWAALNSHGHWKGEVIDRRKDGQVYPKAISISTVCDSRGRVTNYIATFSDVSDRKEVQRRLLHMAHHDALTGLANRTRLAERFDQVLRDAANGGEHLAVLFIDLDNFKTINDSLGHTVGDQVLVELGQRLLASVRRTDIVARFGGDEFVIILSHITDKDFLIGIADKVLTRMTEPIESNGTALHPTCSIGVAVYPYDGEDRETLLRHADTAMYHAKAQGRNNIKFFDQRLNAIASLHLRYDHELRVALAGRQFVLHYQPLVSRDGQVRGVEALLRWNHPSEGMVSPAAFITHLERTGLVVPVGRWILTEACRQLRAWRDAGLHLVMAVNLAEQQLRAPGLVEQVQRALEESGLQGPDLELEITESAAMQEPERAVELLGTLRASGVTLSLDDFGTGYSSLSHLKLLPIQHLKLDRSFVAEVAEDERAHVICAATVAMAHGLGLRVVAEGVESEVQRELLLRLGADYLQGYLFGKPVPASEIPAAVEALVLAAQDKR